MARARNIKPGFFKNEAIAELPFEYRLLFIGLWTLADREGRLEDRPKRIRMELFPADDVDCAAGLEALSGHGLIVRYEAQGNAYIEIPAFCQHQNPHPREAASTIPAHSGNAKDIPRPCQGQSSALSSPADSLNPDVLNPDVPIKASARGTRLPDGWTPDPDLLVWTRAERPAWSEEHTSRILEGFRDYWRAAPGQRGVKLDWGATWRNWVRKEAAEAPKAKTKGLWDMSDSEMLAYATSRGISINGLDRRQAIAKITDRVSA